MQAPPRPSPRPADVQTQLPVARPRRFWLVSLLALAVAIGIFFRFYHLDGKVFWEDETYTSIHVLGLTEAEIVAHAAQYTDAGSLRRVLHPVPALGRTIGDTLHSLAVEDPQHPPLYYVAAHLWVKLLGDSTLALRLLSAIVGVAALPCTYWLCLELFGSPVAGRFGLGLAALSPVAVLFSQEAREYILWSLLIVVASALFLRALRIMSLGAWALYSVALTAALYTFPVTGILALGNIIVAGLLLRRRLRALALPIAATVCACVLFLPWIAVVYNNFHTVSHAMGLGLGQAGSKLDVLKQFGSLLKLNFLDFNLTGRHSVNALLSVPVAGLIGYAFVELFRSASLRARSFTLTMTIFASIPFVLPDVFLGQHFTGNPRYFMPLFIGIDLALVHLFTVKLTSAAAIHGRRWWIAVLTAVCAARVASCSLSANADTWWTKFNEQSIAVAHAIDRTRQPLLLSDEFMERPLSLSNYLDSKVAVQLVPRCYLCRTDARGAFDLTAIERSGHVTDVFVLSPSARVERAVRGAIARAQRHQTYRCIDDRLDERHVCADTLHLWPSP